MSSPYVSVIIPSRDDTHLPSTLASLEAQEGAPAFEVVVVASPDRSIPGRLEFWRDRLGLRVVEASGSTAGAQRNYGVAASRGALLLFVDSDDTVGEAYVRAMADALEMHELVCSCVDTTVLNPWVREETHPQQTGLIVAEMAFLPFAGAGTLGIGRPLFEEIRGFDPLLPCYEEADLCWRIQLAGHEPPVWVPEAKLHYRLEQHGAERWRKATAFGQVQALLYRRYRSAGVPRESVRGAVVAWANLLWRLLRRVARHSTRGEGWQAAIRWGRLRGSVRHRVPYF
ncbi:MAG: glycosyltransferase family 2 protein [Actinomycetota bacterium]